MFNSFSIIILAIAAMLLTLVQMGQAGEIRRLRESVKTLTEDALGRVLRDHDAAHAWDSEEAR